MKKLTVLCLLLGLTWGCSPASDSSSPPEKAKTPDKPPAAPAKPAETAPAKPAETAPAKPVSEALPATPTILESYDVGKDVYVRSLLVEKDKNRLWVGTSVGVMEIDLGNGQVVNTFTRDHGLANEYVFSIGVDRDGAKWFGTNAGGASRYQDGQWKTYFPMHGLADYWVYSFAQHPDGGLWIGTWAGVNRLDLNTGRMDTYIKELINEWVYALAIDAEKRVWFGTEGGISRFDGQQWLSWTHADGLGAENVESLPVSTNTGLGTRNRHDLGVLSGGMSTYNPNYVFSLALEGNGAVWAGTWGGGVSRFDGKEWRSYSRKEGLPGSIVYSLTHDQGGRLWAGTSNGIGYFDQGRWRALAQNHLLLGAHVYALAVSPANELWAGSRGKVYRIGLANKG
ncbi:MAG: regulator [Magnetococcales bacterium]|nr:regulator [Magnetococcales bacterium]